ncbi:hypothetical protein RSAG8_09449, partial [Rhizoctonia solani AG-8 WAC10335]
MARSASPTSTPPRSLLKKAQTRFHAFKNAFEPDNTSPCSKSIPRPEHPVASPEACSGIQLAETEKASSKNQPGFFKRVKNLGKPTWSGVETTLRTLEKSTEAFPPLSSIINELVACLDKIEEATVFRTAFKKFDEEFTETIENLKRLMAERQNAGDGNERFTRLLKYTRGQAESFETSGKNLRGKTFQGFELKKQRRQIEALFRQLQLEVSFILLENSGIQLRIGLLQQLLPAEYARYNSRHSTKLALEQRGCAQESHTKLQADLYKWAEDKNSPRICWVTGAEEATAYDLCERLAKEKRLGASFFCSAETPACNDCSRIVPTIAYQLARYSPEIQSHLCKVLEKDPDVRFLHVKEQWKSLILSMPQDSDSMSDTVVVIDALDECIDQNEVKLMVESLFDCVSLLPFKVLVTIRSNLPVIEGRFSPIPTECDLSNHYFLPPLSNRQTTEPKQLVGKNDTVSFASEPTTMPVDFLRSLRAAAPDIKDRLERGNHLRKETIERNDENIGPFSRDGCNQSFRSVDCLLNINSSPTIHEVQLSRQMFA